MDSVDYFVEPIILEKPTIVTRTLGLLNVYGKKMKRMNPEYLIQQHNEKERKNTTTPKALSANATLKLGRERLIKLNSQKADIFSILINQSSKVIDDTELAFLLQAAAQLVGNKNFVQARKLLNICEVSASRSGSPTQRIAYYFVDALKERMDREWGLISQENISQKRKHPIDVLQTIVSLQPSLMECQQDIPPVVICEFASIQSLFDVVASEERIHIVDLCIKNGSRWIILMEALAARLNTQLKLLKITAIGTSKKMMDETGERLATIALDMKLPFQYNVVLSELKDIYEDMFEYEEDEAVAIFSAVSLWTVLPWPSHLESLLQVLKMLNPCVMILNEIEVCLNSPVFTERSTEALFYFGAVFDSLYVTHENHPIRKLCEEVFLNDMLRNVIVAEGQERFHRQEKVKNWRKIFAKVGIVETDLSRSSTSLLQARLLHKNYAYQSYLTLEMDGKCLIIGWEGTPLQFVSAWKF